MGKRILLHVPGNIKLLNVQNWCNIFNASTAVLPGNEQIADLAAKDENVLKGKLDQELTVRNIDRTEIRLAATIASLQESGSEVWFCRSAYLPNGVRDCFHGIISASRPLEANQEMLREIGFPLWRVTIDNGKIQTTSPGHWFQAKEQFLRELEERTGRVSDTSILAGIQPIPYMSDKICKEKLQEFRTKLEELERHKNGVIKEASKKLQQLSMMHTSFGVWQAQKKREELHQLYSDLKYKLDNLFKSLSLLPAETEGRLALHRDITKIRYLTRQSLKRMTDNILGANESIDVSAPQHLMTLEEIRGKLTALELYKITEIRTLSSSLQACNDKEENKSARAEVLGLYESFMGRSRALKEACLDSMTLYKTPGNAAEWEKTQADILGLIKRTGDAYYSMEKRQAKEMEAGESVADPLSQLAEPVVASLRPVKRQSAPSSTITSAQEEVQQGPSLAKRTRQI